MPRLAVDVSSLRESRDLRLLVAGNLVTGLGTQAALVALPFQLYTQTGSAFLTGLLGAVELVPLVVLALLGGAIADRFDRRRLLLLDQIALVACAAALAALAFALGEAAGPAALRARRAAGRLRRGPERHPLGDPPEPRRPAKLRSALALNFGLYQLTLVVGPALGGLLIAAAGVEWRLPRRRRQLPRHGRARWSGWRRSRRTATARRAASIRRSIGDGLRFVRGNQALMGSFAIDLLAMTFGMPRALFPVLALER